MSDKAYLDRCEAAAYLAAQGLPVAKNTLQKLVTTGGGPIFRRFGHRAVYLREDLDAWASSKLTAPRHTSSRSPRIAPRPDLE